MKHSPNWFRSLIACGLAMALVSTAAAQGVQGVAKVMRIKGSARYSTGNNVWQPLKVGSILRPGTVIQTSTDRGSFVDLVLGDSSAAIPSSASLTPAVARPDVSYYQPNSEFDIVRVYENSLMAIDKLTIIETGADVVTETQLDLRAGRIFGNVKKMSAASKYEVKIPNGVAGIRGTTYEISADGVVKVVIGSVVIAYVGPDGTVVTQVIMGGQQFDARTGQVAPIGEGDQKTMIQTSKVIRVGPGVVPTTFAVDHTIYYVSPTSGDSGFIIGDSSEGPVISGASVGK